MLQHIGGLTVEQLKKKKFKNPWRPAPENSVRRPDMRVVDSMARRAGYWGKTHVYPTQATLCRWLKQDHGITYSRRHLNRHLNALEAANYIRRRTRTDRNTGKHTSTLYWILGRFFAVMRQGMKALTLMAQGCRDKRASIRVPRAAQHLNSIFKSSYLTAGKNGFSPPSTA